MPFTADTVPDNVSEEDADQWSTAWNTSYDACIADDGTVEDCEASAFAIAYAAIKENAMKSTKTLLEEVRDLLRRSCEPCYQIIPSSQFLPHD